MELTKQNRDVATTAKDSLPYGSKHLVARALPIPRLWPFPSHSWPYGSSVCPVEFLCFYTTAGDLPLESPRYQTNCFRLLFQSCPSEFPLPVIINDLVVLKKFNYSLLLINWTLLFSDLRAFVSGWLSWSSSEWLSPFGLLGLGYCGSTGFGLWLFGLYLF